VNTTPESVDALRKGTKKKSDTAFFKIPVEQRKVKVRVRDLRVRFGECEALKGIDLVVYDREILGIIGPARSGKTTFLRALNRMSDLVAGEEVTGSIRLDGEEVLGDGVPATLLRRKLAMVFAVPIALPGSIRENVLFGPILNPGGRGRKELDELLESSLSAAFLWDEVKDRLGESAFNLSGGQQQRLCLARAIALEPEVLLLDEPCSGLDPISTFKIEEALIKLQDRYPVVLVTNNTKQAARVSDRTAFFLMGELVEVDETERIFTYPKDTRTSDYVRGRFG